MHRRLTTFERVVASFGLRLGLVLVVGCESVSLVGVDKAPVLRGDASASGPGADADTLDASPDVSRSLDADVHSGNDDSGALVGADAAALAVWTDPQRPAPLPGQFAAPSTSCPLVEPTRGARCEPEGQQCDYPVCWGRGKRSWVCVDQAFTLWFDESFLCATSRPCPPSVPSQGAACSLSIECTYQFWCCKGPTDFQSARCDGNWKVGQPACTGCADRSP